LRQQEPVHSVPSPVEAEENGEERRFEERR